MGVGIWNRRSKEEERRINGDQCNCKSLKNRFCPCISCNRAIGCSKGMKVVHCKWVFKKNVGRSWIEDAMCTTRLVTKGYNQIPSVDFIDVFSPVIKHNSIWALLTIVAKNDLEFEQIDVKTVFLHGELEKNIYINNHRVS